mgnify:CR=1 FL=1
MAQKRNVSKKKRTAAVAPRSAEFNPDYTDVKNDLRRIGTMAGGFVLVLIVLSFFLN